MVAFRDAMENLKSIQAKKRWPVELDQIIFDQRTEEEKKADIEEFNYETLNNRPSLWSGPKGAP